MRNQPKPLDREAAARVFTLRDRLSECEVVTLHYFKRDGSKSRSTGTVGTFKGRDGMDTMSVDLHTTDKGTRTINLVGVFDFEV